MKEAWCRLRQATRFTYSLFINYYNKNIKSYCFTISIRDLKKDLVYYTNALLTVIDLNANFKNEKIVYH